MDHARLKKEAQEFRRTWSHEPTAIPPNSSGLWYSEECTDDLMAAFIMSRLAPSPAQDARGKFKGYIIFGCGRHPRNATGGTGYSVDCLDCLRQPGAAWFEGEIPVPPAIPELSGPVCQLCQLPVIRTYGECVGCKQGWELGRFGCHYEPLPPDWPKDEDFIRRRIDCTNWAERRKEFYGETVTP